VSRSALFVNDLDLLIDHQAGEAVNRHACRAEGGSTQLSTISYQLSAIRTGGQ